MGKSGPKPRGYAETVALGNPRKLSRAKLLALEGGPNDPERVAARAVPQRAGRPSFDEQDAAWAAFADRLDREIAVQHAITDRPLTQREWAKVCRGQATIAAVVAARAGEGVAADGIADTSLANADPAPEVRATPPPGKATPNPRRTAGRHDQTTVATPMPPSPRKRKAATFR